MAIKPMLIDDLQEVRKCRIQLRRLEEERIRLYPSISPLRLDGMPRGGKGADLEAKIDFRTEIDDRIRRKVHETMQAENRVRKLMGMLSPELYSLCEYYYIGAMSVEDTMRIMNISRSTLYNWRNALKVWTPMESVALDYTQNGVL